MAGSGLIYAAIVAAWVAYLVPSWVRHSEERTHAERTSERMRILRPGTHQAGHDFDDDSGLVESEVTRVSARTARRRRRTLLLLVLTVAGVAAGVGLGYLLAWAPLIPAVALVGYVLMLRRSARRMVLARRRELARQAVRAVSPTAPRRVREERRPAPLIAAAPSNVRTSTAVAQGQWQPRPVPLPTYVTAPQSRRVIRSIDLSAPGAWTSGRLHPPATENNAPPPAEPLPQAVGD
jgi:hypothetical protein